MLDKGDKERGVISMMERDKDRRFAPVKQVETYWNSLRTDGNVPLRSQIDPRQIESALESAFLIERIASSIAKIRVAGTHISDLMGMEVAGMPISSLITPAHREEFGDALDKLFSNPAIIRIALKGEDGFGKPPLTAHIELYPLRSDFGDITRALGVMITHGRVGRAPRRFELSRVTVTQLGTRTNGATPSSPDVGNKPGAPRLPAPPTPADGTRRPYFSGPKQPDEQSVPTAMNKARADYARKQREVSDKPHLRLVISND